MNELRSVYGVSGNRYEYELLTDDMVWLLNGNFLFAREIENEFMVLFAGTAADIRKMLHDTRVQQEANERFGPIRVYINVHGNSDYEMQNEKRDIVAKHHPPMNPRPHDP